MWPRLYRPLGKDEIDMDVDKDRVGKDEVDTDDPIEDATGMTPADVSALAESLPSAGPALVASLAGASISGQAALGAWLK